MARKNPLDTIKNAALGTLMAPIGVAEKAVGQVGRVAGAGVGAVTSLVPGMKTSKEKSPEDEAPDQKAPEQKAPEEKAPEQKAPAPAKPGSVKAAGSLKTGGDPLARAKKAPAPAKPKTQSEPDADQAPAPAKPKTQSEPDAKQAPAPSKPKSEPTAKKAPAAKKAPVKKALPTPVNVTRELGLDPAPVKVPAAAASESKPVTSIDAKADADEVVATPADVAAVLSTHHDEGATDGDRPATLS